MTIGRLLSSSIFLSKDFVQIPIRFLVFEIIHDLEERQVLTRCRVLIILFKNLVLKHFVDPLEINIEHLLESMVAVIQIVHYRLVRILAPILLKNGQWITWLRKYILHDRIQVDLARIVVTFSRMANQPRVVRKERGTSWFGATASVVFKALLELHFSVWPGVFVLWC